MGAAASGEIQKSRSGPPARARPPRADVGTNIARGLDDWEALAKMVPNHQLWTLIRIACDFGGTHVCNMALARIAPYATRCMAGNDMPFLVYLAHRKREGKVDEAMSAHTLFSIFVDAMSMDRMVAPLCALTAEEFADGETAVPLRLDGIKSDSLFALAYQHYQMATVASVVAHRSTNEALFYEPRYLLGSATYTTIGMLIKKYGQDYDDNEFHGMVVCVVRTRERDSSEQIDFYRMLSVRNNMGRTIVHLMAIYMDATENSIHGQFLREMLDHCPTTASILDDAGMTPLMHCAKMRNHRTASLLCGYLKKAADYDQKDASGRTAYDHAVAAGPVASDIERLYRGGPLEE